MVAVPSALGRYYLTLGYNRWLGSQFSHGTFVVNLSGALLMGFFTTLALERVISSDLCLLIAVGFLGSYTPFSTYALDAANLLVGSRRAALFYWVGSAFLGVLSLEAGGLLALKFLT